MATAIGFGLGVVFQRGSVVNYDPDKDDTVVFRSVGRTGLVMEDTIADNDAAIQLPYLYRATGAGYGTITDNGALDIGANDFTMCGWVKDVSTTASSYLFYFGKGVVGTVPGSYAFGTYATSRKIFLAVCTSSESFLLQSNVVSNSTDWHFIYLEIDQTAKKLRWFIDNVQIEADTTFTGTFPALDNKYKFRIGGRNDANGNVAGLSAASLSEIRLYNSLITEAQRTSLYNRVDVSGAKLHLPLSALVMHDISGNNYHPVTSSLTSANIAYGAYGSRQSLNVGYSVWKSPGLVDVQIPLKSDGTAISTTLLSATYYHAEDISGSLTNHNKAESYILFTHGNFDRSNTTIYSAYARAARTMYNASYPLRWHISELMALEIKYNSNADYNAITFPSLTNNVLTEIISVDTKKTAADLKSILKYTNNYDSWHDIEYYVDDRNIVCTRDNYMLIFDAVNSKMQISTDCGDTILREIAVTNFATTGVKMAYIYDDGRIMFANERHIYYSHDLLQTITESTVLGTDGNALAINPIIKDYYTKLFIDKKVIINGTEISVWGQYTKTDNFARKINCYYTIDGGVTVKAFLSFDGDGDPVVSVGHMHVVSFNPADNSIWITTGDNVGNWYKAIYDTVTDTWDIDLIATSDVYGYCKIVGFAWVDDNAIWGSDSAIYGIWQAKYNNMADTTKYIKITGGVLNGANFNDYVTGPVQFGTNLIVSLHQNATLLISSDNGKTWFSHNISGLPALAEGADLMPFITVYPPNSNGYHLMTITELGETYGVNWTLGKALMLKITKP